jgi:PAS domain S-box-containing protein
MTEGATRSQHRILDAIDAGVIVLGGDRRVVWWNAWMVSASGHTAEAALGKSLAELFPDTDHAALNTASASAIDLGASSLLTHSLHSQLLPLKTRAARELLHDVTVSAITEPGGRACLIHIVDVTMAVRRDRYLRRRQNARYDAVVESAPDVILTLDGEAIIRSANRAAVGLFGYSEEEMIGRHASTLFEPPGSWDDPWAAVLSDDTLRLPVELVARRKDGSFSHFEVSASRWQNESRVFVTAILRDINERRANEAALRASEREARKAADALADLNATLEQRVKERTQQLLETEEALRQSHKMEAIGQLTGGIAHDFNNLLQGIIGALNMMQKRVSEGRIGEVTRFLSGALSSAERASALTHRLLAFSRRQPVDPRPVDANRLIGTIEELLRRSLGEKVLLKIEYADDLWLMRCDPHQLENALLNLAINARDAMPDGGTLTIATSNTQLNAAQALKRDLKSGEYVCLQVRDTGVGMPPEVQSRAFDPFYTTKPIGQGTGLGLSMIYGFVRQSEGSVRIESVVDLGTTIEICMPRFTGDLEAVADPSNEIADDHAGSNEVVLVVEDEDIVRLLVVEVLNDLGYRALEAIDGTSAMRIIESSQRIDLLMTDIGLPGMNGRQIADAALTHRPELRVLFMTGYAESAAKGEFLEKGMQIIVKPFTMDKLAAKIREMFELEPG